MAGEKKMGRPAGVDPTAKIAPDEYTKSLCEQVGDGWGLMISFIRWFPDFLLDRFRAEDADYELTLIQRVIYRTKARYQYNDVQGSRSLTKTFCSEGEELVEGIVWPGLRTAYFGPSFKQTARIGSETFATIKKNYPALAAHWTVTADSKDSFEIRTAYNSIFSITAARGDTFHRTVAEEYAQENAPPFDHDNYRAVVKGSMRGEPRILGKRDPTYIPLKQHSITSAGRRQNHSYEIRTRHFEMMLRGDKAAFVMDVPFDVLLYLGMRDVAWAETMKNDMTPDEWAREIETRNTGSDQNPVVRDEVLTESRQLTLMEEHHCCRDLDCREKPEDVIYIVGYDVSYADGAANAKCAAVVVKCTKQQFFLKRDKYMKQVVWVEDWAPADPMRQAQRLKRLWYQFTYPGSQTYISIDAWQYGTAVLQSLMMDLQDGLSPLCVYEHKMFTELELEGAVPVIYPIRAGGVGVTDPDSEMLRYAILQFENRNVQLLTGNYQAAMDSYKKFHRLKDDRMDGFIYKPYQKTQELIAQIQNLKTVPSGAGLSEKRISLRMQRDSWSALKYALRLAQKLEITNLVKPAQGNEWERVYARAAKGGGKNPYAAAIQARIGLGRGLGREGGRRYT